MSQKSNVVNFLIHDANGQPQMVKVVQNSPKQSGPVKIKPSPIKVIKLPATDTSHQGPVYRAVNVAGIKGATSKVVQLPLHTLTKLQKTGEHIKAEIPETEVNVEIDPVVEIELEQSVPELVPIQPVKECQPSSSTSRKSYISQSTMSHAARRQHDADDTVPEYTTKRRKHADKVGKGLRHFSMKVCEKVRTKGFTSYNEVADELVAEFAAGIHGSADTQQYDQKNIRRRVYDALNVLMAMNIISKEKKEIRWLGLPTNSVQECISLEKEKQGRLERIQKKTQQLHELLSQHISFKSLIERNKEAEARGLKPSPSSAIHLPFIVVNTNDNALIDCSISNDKTEYMFNFNKRFQIHDDIDILKRMGLLFGLDKGECTEEEIEKAKTMVPKSLEYFVEQMGRGVVTKISDLLQEDSMNLSTEEDDDEDDGEEEEEGVEEGAAPSGTPEEPDDYSEESSDVDV